VDRGAFVDSLPLTIWNAYYQVRLNSLTILPSVMQFPTYSPTFGTAMKYGRLGTVAGHELMHAFDSKGRLYNAVGNLRIANGQTLPWWTSETTQIFDSRAQCLVEFYNNVDVVDDVKVDGKKTLPENIADIGGMQFAHTAYRRELTGLGDSLSVVPGLTNDQLFFVSFAQNYCQVSSKDALKKQVKIDVHAPASARVFGVLSNTPEFADAFKCAVNTPYNPTVRCSLL
jgi:putative endopeptidase